MKTNYSAVSLPAEKSLEKRYSSSLTPLKDKGDYLLTFRYGDKPGSLRCVLDDLRVIHAEKVGGAWIAKITFDGELCRVGKSKRPLIATGANWTIAVCRLLAIPQFFFKPSYEWLSWFDLSKNKPHLVHPKSNNQLPKNICRNHPTQEWMDSLAETRPEKKPAPIVRPEAKPITRRVSQGKKVSQELRGIGLTREESELPEKVKSELMLRRALA